MSPVSVGTSRSTHLESGKAKLWVLLVGINEYSDSDIPTLRYSADTQKDDLLNTGWGMPELLGTLGECAATQQLVWLDACHSGGMLQQVLYEIQERNRFVGHAYSVNALSVSPDGKIIASASDDLTIKLWNSNGTLMRSLSAHTSPINSISFSPDGQTFASASDDATIKLWQLNGTLIKTLQGHNGGVTSVSFSTEGMLATASRDNIIKLWNRDGLVLKSFEGHNNWLNSVSFSPDGNLLASASDDKTVEIMES